jgi:GNAT superfamily N-acetyltransferase
MTSAKRAITELYTKPQAADGRVVLSASISIRSMTLSDVPAGMRLKELAGWNQTEADWRRYLDLQPDGCFVAELDGVPVGTVATSIFGSVAWIALVLVDPAVRGRGIGTALLNQALAFLDTQKIPSVRLDATPLGRPIYEKLGFSAEFELSRYEDVLPANDSVTDVTPATRECWPELLRLDRVVTGTDRSRWLMRWFEEWPEAVRMLGEPGAVQGFLASRRGSRAIHIGPCLASGATGELLFADACRRFAGQRVLFDIPDDNLLARKFPECLGWSARRHFLRMGRGPKVTERIMDYWASSGPEKG